MPNRRCKTLLLPSEQQVALFLIWGWGNDEIAAKLYLSPGTVKTHCRNIFFKLGINSRAAAVLPLLALLLDYGYSVEEIFDGMDTVIPQQMEELKKGLTVVQGLKKRKLTA